MPRFDSYVDFLIYIEEASQWADAHQLEAIAATTFDAVACDLDLSDFGDDLSLPPPPHGLTADEVL
jgi:hypothetical protein